RAGAGRPPAILDKVAVLQAVCQRLRASTEFHTGFGCVNDQSPRLVPWLPPEEIWCDRFQLPTDLWRILSFDVDVVSTALQSGAELGDPSYGSFAQGALAFGSLLERARNKVVEFEVQFSRMPSFL